LAHEGGYVVCPTYRPPLPPREIFLAFISVTAESRNEKDKACGTCRRDEQWLTRFWWGNSIERGHLKHPNIDGKIILQ